MYPPMSPSSTGSLTKALTGKIFDRKTKLLVDKCIFSSPIIYSHLTSIKAATLWVSANDRLIKVGPSIEVRHKLA